MPRPEDEQRAQLEQNAKLDAHQDTALQRKTEQATDHLGQELRDTLDRMQKSGDLGAERREQLQQVFDQNLDAVERAADALKDTSDEIRRDVVSALRGHNDPAETIDRLEERAAEAQRTLDTQVDRDASFQEQAQQDTNHADARADLEDIARAKDLIEGLQAARETLQSIQDVEQKAQAGREAEAGREAQLKGERLEARAAEALRQRGFEVRQWNQKLRDTEIDLMMTTPEGMFGVLVGGNAKGLLFDKMNEESVAKSLDRFQRADDVLSDPDGPFRGEAAGAKMAFEASTTDPRVVERFREEIGRDRVLLF
ncbi:MAG: hypothetical protein RMA76_16040 [Deltaproteobacteria bacterium]|jgi:hypothetical protein